MTLPASVAAGHPATARVGLDILRAGGSAADAVAAMILAGCVAETIFCGLGGGGFATYYQAADRSVHALDFFVAVPGLDGTEPKPGRAISVSFGGVAVPYEVGGSTVAVPGTPRGVEELHRRFGRLAWAQIVDPAYYLAASGVEFPHAHAALLPDIAPAMLIGAGISAYSDEQSGRLLDGGDTLHHPGLADVLGAYRSGGADVLMSGAFADDLIAQVRADGGSLSTLDLRSYRVRELPTSDEEVSGHRIRARTNDLDGMVRTLAAVAARGSLSRADRAVALVGALRGLPRRAETTSVAAVDADGNGCAATHSLGLGSGIWVSGVHANSMLGEGELVRERLAPGDRMGSMMVPTVVTDSEGALAAVLGAAGGSRIRPALVQVLLRMLIDGEPMPTAVAASRLSATLDAVHLEPGIPGEVVAALEESGETVVQWPQQRPYFGGVSGVGPGGPTADPRRGGAALEFPG